MFKCAKEGGCLILTFIEEMGSNLEVADRSKIRGIRKTFEQGVHERYGRLRQTRLRYGASKEPHRASSPQGDRTG